MQPNFENVNAGLQKLQSVEVFSSDVLQADSVGFIAVDLLVQKQNVVVPVVSAKSAGKPPKISSYLFEPQEMAALSVVKDEPDEEALESDSDTDSNEEISRTRIQPPRDVIKLEDRLFFMLQPPLESILSSRTMRFPFKPFDFQYEGIAFLFPRYSAILADEMGLGKTMQAITAIRLLLRTGSARRILLVCPKPLLSLIHI